MNPTTSTLGQLINWVNTTRQLSTQLDHHADSLLVNLQRSKARARRLAALSRQPLTLGFYGHAQAGKNGLLAALQRHPDDRIEIVLGDKSLDYLTHINPGNIAPAIAVRFSQTPSIEHPQFPLRLALFSECELVYQFIACHQQTHTARAPAQSLVAQRLTELDTRRLPESLGQRYEEDVALLLLEYRRLQRRSARFDAPLRRALASWPPDWALMIAHSSSHCYGGKITL